MRAAVRAQMEGCPKPCVLEHTRARYFCARATRRRARTTTAPQHTTPDRSTPPPSAAAHARTRTMATPGEEGARLKRQKTAEAPATAPSGASVDSQQGRFKALGHMVMAMRRFQGAFWARVCVRGTRTPMLACWGDAPADSRAPLLPSHAPHSLAQPDVQLRQALQRRRRRRGACCACAGCARV